MAEPLLLVESLVREFGARVRTRALAGVDMALHRGEFAALVGPSGSGKSTLLNLIGLLDRPTSGRIVLAGTDTTGLDDRSLTALRAHQLGFIFQFHHLLTAFTALENVLLPAWGDTGPPSRADRAEAEALLGSVGLGDRVHFRANDMSGGQQQRVAIARALVGAPKVILADEPTGNLDSRTSIEVMALFQELGRSGITVMLVTHEHDIAMYAARVITMRDGLVQSDVRQAPRSAADELALLEAGA